MSIMRIFYERKMFWHFFFSCVLVLMNVNLFLEKQLRHATVCSLFVHLVSFSCILEQLFMNSLFFLLCLRWAIFQWWTSVLIEDFFWNLLLQSTWDFLIKRTLSVILMASSHIKSNNCQNSMKNLDEMSEYCEQNIFFSCHNNKMNLLMRNIRKWKYSLRFRTPLSFVYC